MAFYIFGEGNGHPLQHCCLENPMNRGAWQAIVHGVARVGHDLATKERFYISAPQRLLMKLYVTVGFNCQYK